MCCFNHVNGKDGSHTHTPGIRFAVAGSPNTIRDLEVCSNEVRPGKVCGVVASEGNLSLTNWLASTQPYRNRAGHMVNPARRVVFLGGDEELIRACGAEPFDLRVSPVPDARASMATEAAVPALA